MSSFELSPRFSQNFPPGVGRHPSAASSSSAGKGSKERIDLESELQEAMSETVVAEDSLLDGECCMSRLYAC